jgi:uncharacterized protein GlcG (DUF336 family)
MRNKIKRAVPLIEPLEDRTAPALIASQIPLASLPPLTLTKGQVKQLIQRAAAATSSDDAIVAVVDRMGNILGVRVEGNVSPIITSNTTLLNFSIDGAVAEARTAAFFASNAAPLTSRTIQFISQSTVTQREVNSNPDLMDNTSPLYGPGYVAPIGVGGHFPPGVSFTPLVDLFGIEHTNRDNLVSHPTNGSAPVALTGRFNIDPAFVPPGQSLTPPLSYADTILSPADQSNHTLFHPPSRGIGTLPGGIPIYEDGILVGGIGVFFPGTTGYASAENSSLSADFNPNLPDRSLEAEFIALAAVGGSSAAGFPVGTLGGIPPLPGFDLPGGRIDLAGITLDIVGPGGTQGPANLVHYAQTHFAIGLGNPFSGTEKKVDFAGDLFKAGVGVPQGWLVTPHAGVGITAAQVRQIIDQGIVEAEQTRAQIRLPNGSRTEMTFAVTDKTGAVLGLYRMPDATVFSLDVAVAKARNVAYYDDPAQLVSVDRVPGIPAGASFTARTFRFLAQPRFPEGADGLPPGPFSSLNDPGIDPNTGLNTMAPLPPASYTSVLLYDSFHPGSNFRAPPPPVGPSFANRNGVVFFPGSEAVYVHGAIVGGLGVSGDGVEQDDFVTAAADAGFGPPGYLTADHFFFSGVRLPFLKFPRNPTG